LFGFFVLNVFFFLGQAGTQFGSDLALNFQDRVLVALPQNRLSGIACGIVPCLAHASLFVLDGPDFDAKRQVALLAQEGCNVLVGSPSLLQKIFAVPEFSKSADKISKIAIVVDQVFVIRLKVFSVCSFFLFLEFCFGTSAAAFGCFSGQNPSSQFGCYCCFKCRRSQRHWTNFLHCHRKTIIKDAEFSFSFEQSANLNQAV
jgi:hypothetical protein